MARYRKAAYGILRSAGLALALVFPFTLLNAQWESVEEYGGAVNIDLGGFEEAAGTAVTTAISGYGGKALAMDPRLTLAARKLAGQVYDDQGSQYRLISEGRVLDLLHEFGVYENAIWAGVYSFATEGDIHSQIRLQLGDVGGKYTHFGAGVRESDGPGSPSVLVVILSEKLAALDPFPRQVSAPSVRALKGKLVNAASGLDPSVVVTDPSGANFEVEVKRSGKSFSASIPFTRDKGTYRVELVARGGGKSMVSALMVVEAEYASNKSETFEIQGFEANNYGSEEEAESAMVEMINQVRLREGLSPLLVDSRLREMAREHSQDMRKNNFTGHSSPARGGVRERAEAAGLDGIRVMENVAVSPSLVKGMNNFLQSPVHRAPILSPEVDYVGVGIIIDYAKNPRHYVITQEFADL